MTAVTITNAGLNLLRDALDGLAVNCKVAYVAIGTGSTAPAVTDTQLGAEVFRKPITNFTNGASVGESLINMYLAPGDAVGDVVGEIGWFAGAATGAANSGTMVARALYSHTKLISESIQFTLDSTV